MWIQRKCCKDRALNSCKFCEAEVEIAKYQGNRIESTDPVARDKQASKCQDINRNT